MCSRQLAAAHTYTHARTHPLTCRTHSFTRRTHTRTNGHRTNSLTHSLNTHPHTQRCCAHTDSCTHALCALHCTAHRHSRVHSRPSHTQSGAVVYLGHIPYGFFEEQMRGFFSQFGTVGRLRLSRSPKTANPRGCVQFCFASAGSCVIFARICWSLCHPRFHLL
jgi:hypothetical protein